MKFDEVELPSNRRFGSFFALVFLSLSVFCLLNEAILFSIIFVVLSCIFALAATFLAELLLPFNKLWMRYGLLLGSIVNPMILGAIFFLIFTPMGLLMKLFGRDELQLKKADRSSYWKIRNPRGPSGESFKNQF